ncbi:zinc finger CCHC domain-containing protein 2-like [Mizuhopecten yessoensis]|uniref:Zinc finger CCHC domain-containing protein 2 n=1 Tax=Mizuhopecten yessoensis TaxID=6573 RepID=A0A210PNE0_MIZYE|nr:zinc finger CCHC domain-containing protein 2-like [Mizuhopecten yessoensis]OWF37987.1 Zinc finger CCHC domain-containing protein 2 [Mizuhopecten yessoensis]
MVCKEFEELCGKFGSLSPHKRIDIMCGMLRMCLPPELRFIGSVVEDLAKKDYHFLREHEIRANSQEKLSEIKHNDPHALANNMALSLALLHSWNASCANIIFEILTSNLKSAFDVTWASDTATRDVILLVLMMAKNHPAFTFYQKTVIGEHNERQNILLTSNIETEASAATSTSTTSTVAMATGHMLQGPMIPRACNCSTTPPVNSSPPIPAPSPHKHKVHICNIDVKQDKGHRRHDRKHEYRLQVTWSNGETSTVSKTYQELREFQAKLVKEFSAEASAHKLEKKLPFLGNASSGTREDIISYTKQLTQQSQSILECDLVKQFFQQGCNTASTSPPSPAGSACPPAECPVKAVPNPISRNVSEATESVISNHHPAQPLVIHNSHLPQTMDNVDVTGMSCVPLKGQVSNKPVMSIQRPMGLASPHPSPQSSNGASPSNSRSNSPGDTNHNPELALIQFLLSKLNLQKHRNYLEKYTSEQLCVMKIEDLIQIGLSKEEALKLKAEAELIYREKMSHPPNGLIEGPLGPRCHPSPPMVMPFPHQLPVHPQGGALAQPPLYPHMFIYSAFPPGPPGLTQTRDSSPTGSDYSSPSPSPRPQKKGTAILMPNSVPRNSDSSSDDNEKDKLAGMETGRHPSQHQVPSPMGLEDPNSVPLLPGVPNPMFVHGEGPPVPPMGSGYQSDPTPSAFLPRVPSMINRPNYKAQPAHTNHNIPTKHVISMPPEALKRNGPFAGIPIGMAPHIPRSDGQTITTSVMTAANSSANSGFNFMDPNKHNFNWMPVPQVPGYQIRSPLINGNQRGFTCNVTNATSITMATQPVSCAAIHPGHPANSLKNSNSHGQLSVEAGCGPQENIHSVAPMVQNSSPSPAATTGCTGSHIMHAATSQASTTCSSATCSSCGSPCGHAYPATYPYHTNSLPHPLTHAPFWHMSPHFSTSNGLVPQMLRYPGIPYHIPQPNNFPNGLTPDILSLNNHPFISHGVPTPFMAQRGSSGYYPYHTLVRQPSREEKSRKASCSNCGSPDHNSAECRENSMEHYVGHFRLNYEPKSNSD